MWRLLSGGSSAPNSPTFAPLQDIVSVGVEDLSLIEDLARKHPLGRARLLLHLEHTEPIQEMLIAVRQGCYFRPHRQRARSKTYKLFHGRMLVVFFDEQGQMTDRRLLTEGGPALAAVRFPADLWHTVIALSPMLFYMETTLGPYRREDTEYADWAPAESDEKAFPGYLAALQRLGAG
jgi:cupin fold WbuC family metalloprotein